MIIVKILTPPRFAVLPFTKGERCGYIFFLMTIPNKNKSPVNVPFCKGDERGTSGGVR